MYDGVVEKPVDIVGLDYDYWFEMSKADGDVGPEEHSTPLSVDGVLYYVRFQHAGETSEPTWVDSGGYTTIEKAVREAEGKIAGGVQWTSDEIA
ncbi:MAG TPA: hypothetical protein VGP73_14950 [Thermoanaerobaculia bacterium]